MFRLVKFSAFAPLVMAAGVAFAGPVIDPISNASIPAGKSLTLPVTATSTNGRPLAYTVTSSTNRITVELHTNNPFWKLSVVQVSASNAPGAYLTPFRGALAMVTNVGDLTLMLFRDRAPRTVEVFQGLTMSGFYNSNTIFHRVIPSFMIQGGDPTTNGSGGPIFRFDDEFHPRSIFSGNGQLAMANSGKDTDGSQFFITQVPYRSLDLSYTHFGQLLRGFPVLTNIINTPRDANDRPLRNVIITRASFVTNYTDTVITITGTNLAGVVGTIRVVADDGTVGGRVTNTFTTTTVSDAANNAHPIIYPNIVTNWAAPINARLTNYVASYDLEGNTNYWFPYFRDYESYVNASNTIHTNINGMLRLTLIPATNYVGPLNLDFFVSGDPNWGVYYVNFDPSTWPPYDYQTYTFAIGDTAVSALPTNFSAAALTVSSSQVVATFTNGVPNSSATNFTASIYWGDNTVSSGTYTTNVNGRKEVRGSHTFTNSGLYPVRVTVASKVGASATVVSTATVAPALEVSRAGSNSTLRWPAWASDFSAQTLADLNSTNWTALTNLPVLVGHDNVLTNASTASNLFYRLKR